MENRQLIEGLNDALNRELSTAIRYLVQSSLIKGLPNEPLREMYRRELSDEMKHAQYLADKIVILGGTPIVKSDMTPPGRQGVRDMIESDLVAEEDDVRHYMTLASLAKKEGDIELKVKMEEQAAEESRHAEALRRLHG